jgi:tetratricopeptide (TPR) repeat protein
MSTSTRNHDIHRKENQRWTVKLRNETENLRARVLLDLGLEAMRAYQDSGGNLAVLDEAEGDLNAAVEADPAFLPAIYFRGITRDLKGESDAAIADLERVVNSEPALIEARFNLGVAFFHKYHVQNLKRAESEFEKVLSVRVLALGLRLQTLASLAQTRAQLMIQSEPQVDVNAVKARLHEVLEIGHSIDSELASQTPDPQVGWRLENARGLGFMFASDYLDQSVANGSKLDRPKMLSLALKHFRKADEISPNNWAVVCNLGSVWMRSAYWERKDIASLGEDAFQNSFDHLSRVVEVLRPNYGFALYEIGRLHRLVCRFEDALEWFKRAEGVPESKRDVSFKTLQREIDRAEKGIDEFP